jgi:hypothetical protein
MLVVSITKKNKTMMRRAKMGPLLDRKIREIQLINVSVEKYNFSLELLNILCFNK